MLTHQQISDTIQKAADEFAITKAAYFGSYADGCATENSDLDLLVEFDRPSVSILTVIGLKQYLEDELNKPVDVIHAPIPHGSLIEVGMTIICYNR